MGRTDTFEKSAHILLSFELGCALRKVLETDNSLVLVAEARDAYSARDKIIKYEPDVMLLGNDLPRMSGVTFLERLIPQYHIPAVMLADSRYKESASVPPVEAPIAIIFRE